MVKKDFKIEAEANINPALGYLSKPPTDNTHNTDNTQPTHDTPNAENKPERKSKRLNLLIQPSLLDDLSKIATMKKTSVNDLICRIVKDYNETEAKTITRYDEIFND